MSAFSSVKKADMALKLVLQCCFGSMTNCTEVTFGQYSFRSAPQKWIKINYKTIRTANGSKNKLEILSARYHQETISS